MIVSLLSEYTAPAKTSNTKLDRTGDSEHPCLAPNLKGKAFSFSPLSSTLAAGL